MRFVGDWRPHFSFLAMPFAYLVPYALRGGVLACTNAAIADAAQHVNLPEGETYYYTTVTI
jgi:hypothetical protein